MIIAIGRLSSKFVDGKQWILILWETSYIVLKQDMTEEKS
tara:strand:+ start:460 stop:579 length:120 start_codon:yes stop_codon:yes gene_type:complete